jgi:hypothetical protein
MIQGYLEKVSWAVRDIVPYHFLLEMWKVTSYAGGKTSVCPLKKFTKTCYLLDNQDLSKAKLLSIQCFVLLSETYVLRYTVLICLNLCENLQEIQMETPMSSSKPSWVSYLLSSFKYSSLILILVIPTWKENDLKLFFSYQWVIHHITI